MQATVVWEVVLFVAVGFDRRALELRDIDFPVLYSFEQ